MPTGPEARQDDTGECLAKRCVRQGASTHATERLTGEPAYCTDFSAGGPKKAALSGESVL
jgi:hypothetical protein